jgi:broad specificity phosphatase PhoE
MIEFLIVQHAEKDPTAANQADPGLTERGRMQAQATEAHLRGAGVASIHASPLRRTRETAEPIAAALGLAVRLDARLRERMNWGDSPTPQSIEHFLQEWARATQDRDFTPASGDSSRVAGQRFQSLLEDLARLPGQRDGERIVLVAHGGVTADLLRNLFPDEMIRARAPEIIEHGVPSCAITHLIWRDGVYELKQLASVAHLPLEESR